MYYILLIALAVFSRLLPHIPNVTPLGGLALLVGATYLNQEKPWQRWLALSLPIVALLISDWQIGFYSLPVMASVYIGFAITILLGTIVRRSYRWQTIVGASLLSSVIFFLLTNAAVWAFTPMYSQGLSGLGQSYLMALPFFRNSLLGDLLYTGVFFGLYTIALRQQIVPQLKTQTT